MSDGGKDISKYFDNNQKQQQEDNTNNNNNNNNNNNVNCSTRNPRGNNDFIEAIAKNAVAQICDYEGFQGFHSSALDAFADVAVKYVMELGKSSILYANQSGRSRCNVFDVILGLENLGSIQGFSGASNFVNPWVSNSGTVRDISQYVSLVEPNPFVFTLPRFPVSKSRLPPSSFLEVGVDPPCHVPSWLPAFPVLETEFNGGKDVAGDVPKAGEIDVVNAQEPQQEPQQKQQQQQQQQLVANNGVEAVEINPFLAPPFAFGEKEVSIIEPPSRVWEGNHVHSMDMFAQDEDLHPRNEVTEVEDASKDVKVDERPSVRFKFRETRKSLCVFKNVVSQMDGEDGTVSVLVERNDENDEKKRRAEQILKESMETPLDTTEL